MPSACESQRDLLPLYCEGELRDPQAVAAVREHLLRCADCRDRAARHLAGTAALLEAFHGDGVGELALHLSVSPDGVSLRETTADEAGADAADCDALRTPRPITPPRAEPSVADLALRERILARLEVAPSRQHAPLRPSQSSKATVSQGHATSRRPVALPSPSRDRRHAALLAVAAIAVVTALAWNSSSSPVLDGRSEALGAGEASWDTGAEGESRDSQLAMPPASQRSRDRWRSDSLDDSFEGTRLGDCATESAAAARGDRGDLVASLGACVVACHLHSPRLAGHLEPQALGLGPRGEPILDPDAALSRF